VIDESWGAGSDVGTLIAAHDPLALWHKARVRSAIMGTGEGCRARH